MIGVINCELVRAIFFLTTLNNLHLSPKMFALIWTYPVINMVVVSYCVSSQWIYDLVTLRFGGNDRNVLRRHMQVFAIAVVVFIVIIYLIYMLSLPALEDRSDFQSIFYGLAVMQWITAAILLCSGFLYLK